MKSSQEITVSAVSAANPEPTPHIIYNPATVNVSTRRPTQHSYEPLTGPVTAPEGHERHDKGTETGAYPESLATTYRDPLMPPTRFVQRRFSRGDGRLMAASYPKPDAQKVTRHELKVAWVDLPSKRAGRAPALPAWREWDPRTRKWWAALWRKPQATQWEPSGSTLWVYAALMDALIAGDPAAKVSAGVRQHEDRHGLSPKAMTQLRWRLAGEEPKVPERSPASSAAERRKRLRVV